MLRDDNFQFPCVKFHDLNFFFITDRLYVEDEKFDGGYQYFQIPDYQSIVSIVRRYPPAKAIEHLEVNTRDHQYVLVGGPAIIDMYLVPIR
jgi:hypothetical protein